MSNNEMMQSVEKS